MVKAAEVQDQAAVAPQLVDLETHYRIEHFLRYEARVLDEEDYQAWLGLLDPQVHYLMPVPRNTYARNRPGKSTLSDMAIYDECYDDLKQRARREETGLVWLNDPPTRHLRLVTNVEAYVGDQADRYHVYSKFILYRSRRERDIVYHFGRREDELVEVDGGFRLLSRVIHLPERVILDKNLNMFF